MGSFYSGDSEGFPFPGEDFLALFRLKKPDIFRIFHVKMAIFGNFREKFGYFLAYQLLDYNLDFFGFLKNPGNSPL